MKTLNQFLEQGEPAKETEKEDPKVKQAQAKENMLKKRVLMTKMRAVRGGATGIMASHEPDGELVEGVMKMIKSVTRKKKEKKAEKAMDAGARARRKLARKAHAHYVSGSEDNVPDDIRESDVHSGQGEKIQKRTKKWMDKKGMKGAPGLDAMKARTAEHRAKLGVKEEVEDLQEYSPNVTYQAKGGKKSGKLGKSSVYSLKDKGESKKEFRKSQIKDIKGGYLKTEALVEPKDGVDSAKEVRKATRKAAFRPFNKEEKDAFAYVVAKLKKQHGDGVLTKRDKIKPQSAAEKAKVRAHQAKIDKENAAERAKDPSQGRYPKG